MQMIPWALTTRFKGDPLQELPDEVHDIVQDAKKKCQLALDTIAAAFLESHLLKLLMAGKIHEAKKAPLDMTHDPAGAFFMLRPSDDRTRHPGILLLTILEDWPCWFSHGELVKQS
jgi:hypothetical protein